MFNIESKKVLCLHLVLLSLLCGSLFFLHLDRFPFFNKGEPREALVVQSIVREGGWLFPVKSGGDIPSKPPLFHWVGALASIVRGQVTEATVRFPSAFFATLGVFIIYVLGRKLFDAYVAFLGATILATTMVYQNQAIAARVDMTLAFSITVSLAIFYGLYRGFLAREAWYYLFFGVVGLSVLAKGPVSLILTGLVVVSFLGVRRQWRFLSRLSFHKGILLTLGIVVSWYALGLEEGGGEFFARQVIKENLARFFVYGEGGTGHQKPFYYYIPYLFAEGLPWSLFLLFVGADLIRRIRRDGTLDEDSTFLSIWVLAVFFFFSLAAGKRSVYLLPLYPPLSLLIAAWFYQSVRWRTGEVIALRFVSGFCLLTGLVVLGLSFDAIWNGEAGGFFAMLAPRLKAKDQANLLIVREALVRSAWLYPAFLIVLSLLWLSLGRHLWHFQPRAVALRVALIALLSTFLAHGMIVPAIAESRSYGPFMEQVNRRVAESDPLFIYGGNFDSSPLFFYRGEPIPILQESPEELVARLGHSDGSIIISREDWQRIRATHRDLPAPTLESTGNGADGDAPLVLLRRAKDDASRGMS